MTQRQDLQRHRQSLGEVREIMSSMQTLAYMETRKLTRFVEAQAGVLSSILTVAEDFVAFHQDILPEAGPTLPVYLLIGSERGFCGDFNQALLRHLEAELVAPTEPPLLIGIGHKLNILLEDDPRCAARIDGASVVEEIATVLAQLAEALTTLQQEHGVIALYAICHDTRDRIAMEKLLPPFQQFLHRGARHGQPPDLNLPPADFLIELTEHYLFAALHALLYASLMAENRHRVTHLESATHHLDDELDTLTRRYNMLRQEEIVEEIEVMLLNTCSPDDSWHPHQR